MKPNNNIAPLSETPALNTPANAGLGLDIHFSGIGGIFYYNTMTTEEIETILKEGKALVKITLDNTGINKPACDTLIIKRIENNKGLVMQASPFPLWEGWVCENFCNLFESKEHNPCYPVFVNSEGNKVVSTWRVVGIKYLLD